MKSFFIFITTLATLTGVANANSEVAIITHPDNQQTLDKDTLTRIFLGKDLFYPSGDKVTPVQLDGSVGSHEEFVDKLLGKSPKQFNAYWARMVFTGKAPMPATMASSADMKTAVAKDTSAIGYIDSAEVDGSVKVVMTLP